jgi:hypothetical protein
MPTAAPRNQANQEMLSAAIEEVVIGLEVIGIWLSRLGGLARRSLGCPGSASAVWGNWACNFTEELLHPY